MYGEKHDAKASRSQMDKLFGYETPAGDVRRTGWLINFHSTDFTNAEGRSVSAVEYYFIEDDGRKLKLLQPYKPYFYVALRDQYESEFASSVCKMFSGLVDSAEVVWKEDLDLANHLSGLKKCYVKLSFLSVSDLVAVREEVLKKLRMRQDGGSIAQTSCGQPQIYSECLDYVVDIREYDVPYHIRVAIDTQVFVGFWYEIHALDGNISEITVIKDRLMRPEPCVLAFDIETTKAPLKFPDASCDVIMMISYMVNGQGYLIVNRAVVSADVEDFEYTPRPDYEGQFRVFNEANEYAVLIRFFEHFQNVRPDVVATYNGDSFDWPFIDARATALGLNLYTATGFQKDKLGEYKCRHCAHMDAYRWVKRDSYLPMGSHSLKACTRMKLRYNPVELDPEDLMPMAQNDPQTVANYSVSDAVATYYLYMTYVHPFIFALCTIIPMKPDEVLRKGSGTLCEALLMVEAFRHSIVFPNKKKSDAKKFSSDGHLVLSETYVGGHVEALECGVYKADIPCDFHLSPETLQNLMDELPETIQYACETEDIAESAVSNMDQVCEELAEKLKNLRDKPYQCVSPLIYHLDVAAMYPNIILTNRLQPAAVVNESICARCDYNRPGAKCQKVMDWVWRGELLPANRSEYQWIMQQMNAENLVPSSSASAPKRGFQALSSQDKQDYTNKRLKDYCRKAYGRNHDYRTEVQKTIICQREHSFYVDTIRAFRDRRYDYKCLHKKAKRELDDAVSAQDFERIKLCKNNVVLFDSLQLAHKCILNSFYGYVMRLGSRWHSMEMAGIVCHTGAQIIKMARQLIERIGRPLELDTDGIWCALPSGFPEKIVLQLTDNAKVVISYPAAALNIKVRKEFTNSQYHVLEDPQRRIYSIRSENTIAFEVDGPYKAMVLPSAKEEGKKLKKRYAVYNFDGSIAELKGFELKRRGELQLIKIFQSSIFDGFLNGSTLPEVYSSVASVANYWLDILYSKGVDIPDQELFDLISENRSLSKKLESYDIQRSAPIVAAKRMAEFLGEDFSKESGLNCRIVIMKEPRDASTSERAVPLTIFQAEPRIRCHYLRRWLKRSDISEDFEVREMIDWEYYIDRLSSAILKMITIPAALQGVPNPVPRVPLPDWVKNKVATRDSSRRQVKLTDVFERVDDAKDDNFAAPMIKKAKVVNKRPPSPEKNFVQSWISGLKKRWLMQSKRNYRMGRLGATSESTNSRLGRIAWTGSTALLHSPWSVVQVCTTSEGGLFNLWVLIGNDLHSVRLRVPRIFYVNQKVPKELESTDAYRKVVRILPHSRVAEHLYEYEVPDDKFKRHISDLNTEMSAFHIEGIYETNVPLLFRVFLHLGTVCKVKPNFRNMPKIPDEFGLNHLEALTEGTEKYLRDDNLKKLFLYFYAQDSRSIWTLWNDESKTASVWIVDRGSLANYPNLLTMYKRERLAKMEAHPNRQYPDENVTFTTKMEATVASVYKAVNAVLKAYSKEKRGPTVVYFIAPDESEEFSKKVPSLSGFPTIKLRIVEAQNMFSVLDWQRVACRQAINHILNLSNYITTFKDLCRYMQIPLGNVPADPVLFSSDLSYARYLSQNGYVLWCSLSDRPDFGGKELDDVRLSTEPENAVSIGINKPKFWKDICVELEIASLPLVAMLQAHRILDYDEATGICGFMAPKTSKKRAVATLRSLNSYSNDEAIVASGSFKLLRTMVHGWLKEVTMFQNIFADNQLINFYRWLGTPSALLYDPAMKRALDSLIKKLFLMLITELDQLGAQVIWANWNRVVLCSKRRVRKDALAHVNYLVRAVQSKEQFSLVGLNTIRVWKVLLWMDSVNYAGVDISSGDAPSTLEQSAEEEEDDVGLKMNWQLAYFLPTAYDCQTNFEVIVSGYVMVVHKFLLSKEGKEAEESVTTDGTEREELTAFCHQLINGELNDRLFNIVQKIQGDLSIRTGYAGLASIFPRNIGSYLKMTNPALELCKAVCQVLSLDECIVDEVARIKRDMLKLLHVGEFSDEAEWRNPSLSLVLSNFVCRQCNMSRDLDICRDFDVIESNGVVREVWRCLRCNMTYETSDIEFRLTQHLNNFLRAYFSQDLKCERCDQVKDSDLRFFCSCGGRFRCTLNTEGTEQRLAVYRNIAEKFEMPVFSSALSWLTSE